MKLTLKALRVNYGLTQREMSNIVGCSIESWRNYENGITVPNNKVVEKIITTFKVNYNDIIFSRRIRLNSSLT